jgi:trehalose 6-phosphate synthase
MEAHPMRFFSARLIIALICGVTLVSASFTYYQVDRQRQTLRQDLQHRAQQLGESLADNVESQVQRGAGAEVQRIVTRFSNREHLAGVGVYDKDGNSIAVTAELRPLLSTRQQEVAAVIQENESKSFFLHNGNVPVHLYISPIVRESQVIGGLAIVHDATYIRDHSRHLWWETFWRVLMQVLLIAGITVAIVRWSVEGPIARAAQWMKALRTGRISSAEKAPEMAFLQPLAREVQTFVESLHHARSAAETEARLREAAESLWTPERLAVHVQSRLEGSRLFVVSNREPYTHVRNGKAIEVTVPASGLVTALEPVLRACDGTWVAHGNGNADAETVDDRDCLRVPPEDPRYTLRRVWLSKEDEDGYYYGFANEGLWPLCHIAHTRPIFRVSDFERYRLVNEKFADALCEEMAETKDPVVLLQDYHFALLPKLVKERRPDARVAIFWHIPWPNPEAFGICPWQRELLDGLLAADLIGFHVQAHCNNFLQTVDRALECRIDWEHFTAQRLGRTTLVKPFPISVDFTEAADHSAEGSVFMDRVMMFQELGVEATLLGVGVDRVDYTKGMPERFLAIERFLEKNPYYQGKFVFVQIGAPSRGVIRRYQELMSEVEGEAERINRRFAAGKWKPIVFLKRHHGHKEIQRYYRAADLCLVTSLHDGMNLVAKEFVASREDNHGVLILSQFTGAARELRDALQVNPYNIDQTADAIYQALRMSVNETTERMQRMRRTVREHNVYGWAGSLVAELCGVRLEHAPAQQSASAGVSAA